MPELFQRVTETVASSTAQVFEVFLTSVVPALGAVSGAVLLVDGTRLIVVAAWQKVSEFSPRPELRAAPDEHGADANAVGTEMSGLTLAPGGSPTWWPALSLPGDLLYS